MQINVTCQNTDCCLSTEYGGWERQKERVTKDTKETFGCNGYVIILIVVRFRSAYIKTYQIVHQNWPVGQNIASLRLLSQEVAT